MFRLLFSQDKLEYRRPNHGIQCLKAWEETWDQFNWISNYQHVFDCWTRHPPEAGLSSVQMYLTFKWAILWRTQHKSSFESLFDGLCMRKVHSMGVDIVSTLQLNLQWSYKWGFISFCRHKCIQNLTIYDRFFQRFPLKKTSFTSTSTDSVATPVEKSVEISQPDKRGDNVLNSSSSRRRDNLCRGTGERHYARPLHSVLVAATETSLLQGKIEPTIWSDKKTDYMEYFNRKWKLVWFESRIVNWSYSH